MTYKVTYNYTHHFAISTGGSFATGAYHIEFLESPDTNTIEVKADDEEKALARAKEHLDFFEPDGYEIIEITVGG